MSAEKEPRGARARFPFRGAELSSAAGIVAAVVIALLVNVLAGRHYRRFDATTHRLYTLSAATVETLDRLGETVNVDVLLPSTDPLAASVRFLLDAYASRTNRLAIRYLDPDRHPAEFMAAQQKYGIEAGRTENGQVVTDAAIVLSKNGGKPFFIAAADLVDEGREGEGGRSRSRLEQALTSTLRGVLEDDRPKICFTTGHGERSIDDSGPRGLGDLASRLRKNNYDVSPVDASAPPAPLPSPGTPPAAAPSPAIARTAVPNPNLYGDCRAVVIAGPTEPFTSSEAARVRRYLELGGNALIMAGPVPDPREKRYVPLGLDAITTAGGIALDEDFVFETDAERKLPDDLGEQFFAEAKAHDITAGLVGDAARDLHLFIVASRSLSRAKTATIVPADLLVTSKDAFGMVDFFAWAARGGDPAPAPQDRRGPLVLAMASELPRPPGAQARAHGPRLVVVGTTSLAQGQNWQEHALRGGALFTESALSWITARPPLVDIPDKPGVAALRISEDSLDEVLRYVVLYMPAAALLLGAAVFLRRRSTERGAGA